MEVHSQKISIVWKLRHFGYTIFTIPEKAQEGMGQNSQYRPAELSGSEALEEKISLK